MFSHQLSNLYFSAISCHAVIFSCNAKIISVLRMIGNRGNDSKLLSLHGRFAVIAVFPLQLSVEAPKGGDEKEVGHEPGPPRKRKEVSPTPSPKGEGGECAKLCLQGGVEDLSGWYAMSVCWMIIKFKGNFVCLCLQITLFIFVTTGI